MTITELIAKLQAVQAEHGDLPVLSEGEADYDEHALLRVGTFIPSGNEYCGGAWRRDDEATWVADRLGPKVLAARTLAVYLTSSMY